MTGLEYDYLTEVEFEKKLDENGSAYEIVHGVCCPVQTSGPVSGFHRLLAVNLKKRYSSILSVSDLDSGEVGIIINTSESIDVFELSNIVMGTLKAFYKLLGKRRPSGQRLMFQRTIPKYENELGQKAWNTAVFLLTGAPVTSVE
jgi:hypothetical protein